MVAVGGTETVAPFTTMVRSLALTEVMTPLTMTVLTGVADGGLSVVGAVGEVDKTCTSRLPHATEDTSPATRARRIKMWRPINNRRDTKMTRGRLAPGAAATPMPARSRAPAL